MLDQYNVNENKYLEKKLVKSRGLKSVSFFIVNLAVLIQTLILMIKNQKGGELRLVYEPNKTAETVKLVVYKGFKMNPLVGSLIRLSFTSKRIRQDELSLKSCLANFVDAANDALKDNDVSAFNDAIEQIIERYAEISSVMSHVDNTGKPDNWLHLKEEAIWGDSYLDEIMKSYSRLSVDAASRIVSTTGFYYKTLYLFQRIYLRIPNATKFEAAKLIEENFRMWFYLLQQRYGYALQEDSKMASNHDAALYDFAGAWEHWLLQFQVRSKAAKETDELLTSLITHLECTASAIVLALRFDDFSAADLGVDMLAHWFENIHIGRYNTWKYNWSGELVNHTLLSQDQSPIWPFIFNQEEYDSKAAFNKALYNAQRDIRLITASYLLLKPKTNDHERIIGYAKCLLDSKNLQPDNFLIDYGEPINNLADFLDIFIRLQNYLDPEQERYKKWITSVIERFSRIDDTQRRIVGRVYSGWGASIDSLNEAYVELGVYLSSRQRGLSRDWEYAIEKRIFNTNAKNTLISDLNKLIDTAKNKEEFLLVEPSVLELNREIFVSSLEKVIEEIEQIKNQEIAEASVDSWCEKTGARISNGVLSQKSQSFPIHFFSKTEAIPAQDSFIPQELVCRDFKKEFIVDDGGRIINSDRFFLDEILKRIKINILEKISEINPQEKYQYNDINSLLSDLKELSKGIDEAVLLIGDSELTRTLFMNYYKEDFAKKYSISYQDGLPGNYICHIGACEIYHANSGLNDNNFLMSKKIFENIYFEKITEKQFVKVQFTPYPEDSVMGNLVFSYNMKVEVSEKYNTIKIDLSEREKE